jgi:hypothetical protein
MSNELWSGGLGASETMQHSLCSNMCTRKWQCDKESCRDAASNCPHAQFLGQNAVNDLLIQIQLTIHHCDSQTRIRPHENLLSYILSFFAVRGRLERGYSSTISWLCNVLYNT